MGNVLIKSMHVGMMKRFLFTIFICVHDILLSFEHFEMGSDVFVLIVGRKKGEVLFIIHRPYLIKGLKGVVCLF